MPERGGVLERGHGDGDDVAGRHVHERVSILCGEHVADAAAAG